MKNDIELLFQEEFISKFKQKVEPLEICMEIMELAEFLEKAKSNQKFKNLIIKENGLVFSVIITIKNETYMN